MILLTTLLAGCDSPPPQHDRITYELEVVTKKGGTRLRGELFVGGESAGELKLGMGDKARPRVERPAEVLPHELDAVLKIETVCGVKELPVDVPASRYPADPAWRWERVQRDGFVKVVGEVTVPEDFTELPLVVARATPDKALRIGELAVPGSGVVGLPSTGCRVDALPVTLDGQPIAELPVSPAGKPYVFLVSDSTEACFHERVVTYQKTPGRHAALPGERYAGAHLYELDVMPDFVFTEPPDRVAGSTAYGTRLMAALAKVDCE